MTKQVIVNPDLHWVLGEVREHWVTKECVASIDPSYPPVPAFATVAHNTPGTPGSYRVVVYDNEALRTKEDAYWANFTNLTDAHIWAEQRWAKYQDKRHQEKSMSDYLRWNNSSNPDIWITEQRVPDGGSDGGTTHAYAVVKDRNGEFTAYDNHLLDPSLSTYQTHPALYTAQMWCEARYQKLQGEVVPPTDPEIKVVLSEALPSAPGDMRVAIGWVVNNLGDIVEGPCVVWLNEEGYDDVKNHLASHELWRGELRESNILSRDQKTVEVYREVAKETLAAVHDDSVHPDVMEFFIADSARTKAEFSDREIYGFIACPICGIQVVASPEAQDAHLKRRHPELGDEAKTPRVTSVRDRYGV